MYSCCSDEHLIHLKSFRPSPEYVCNTQNFPGTAIRLHPRIGQMGFAKYHLMNVKKIKNVW